MTDQAEGQKLQVCGSYGLEEAEGWLAVNGF